MHPAHRESSSSTARPPLFVVGMWRSGTSLFYALLNQHPEIALLYEDDLPLLGPLFVGGKAKSDWPERWEFWNQSITRHKLNIHDLPRNAASIQEACEAAWTQYAPHELIRGCKSPNYFDCLPRLAEQFPDAKFIVIWRDPADVCRSVVRARTDSFFNKPGMLLRALQGCRDLKSGTDALVARGVSVHQVQYEDLVANPTGVMQGVCRFLNLEFDCRMISLKDADRSAIYEASHHEMVNSENIVPGKKKAEVLPDRIRNKVARYISFWKSESAGVWPRFHDGPEIKPGPLFVIERIVDRALYRSLRAFDRAVAMLYCYLPIGILRQYRASKGRPAPDLMEVEVNIKQAVPVPRNGTEKELVGASQKH